MGEVGFVEVVLVTIISTTGLVATFAGSMLAADALWQQYRGTNPHGLGPIICGPLMAAVGVLLMVGTARGWAP